VEEGREGAEVIRGIESVAPPHAQITQAIFALCTFCTFCAFCAFSTLSALFHLLTFDLALFA